MELDSTTPNLIFEYFPNSIINQSVYNTYILDNTYPQLMPTTPNLIHYLPLCTITVILKQLQLQVPTIVPITTTECQSPTNNSQYIIFGPTIGTITTTYNITNINDNCTISNSNDYNFLNLNAIFIILSKTMNILWSRYD